jgi:hypothetical protein
MMDTCRLEAEKCGEEMGRFSVKIKMKRERERERERAISLSLSLQLQMQSADEVCPQFAFKDSAVSVTKLLVG